MLSARSDSVLRRRHPPDPPVTIHLDDQPVVAAAGESVAAAVLAAAGPPTRTTAVSGAPRAPYCMMGICFECLMEIDGIASRQACRVMVREGMRIRRQAGAREVDG
jgi:D-hydroxyproline dehydrogenase subunit gamma